MFHNYVAASACWIHNICVSSMARVLKHFNFWKITEMWKEKIPFSANIIFDFSKNKKYNRAFLIQLKDYFVWMCLKLIFFFYNLMILNFHKILLFYLIILFHLFYFTLFIWFDFYFSTGQIYDEKWRVVVRSYLMGDIDFCSRNSLPRADQRGSHAEFVAFTLRERLVRVPAEASMPQRYFRFDAGMLEKAWSGTAHLSRNSFIFTA